MKRVICLGSPQGADRAAWLLADALDAQVPSAASAEAETWQITRCASPAQMVGLFAGTEAVAIIDAVAQWPSGRVCRLNVNELRRDTLWSSHGLDLVTVLELARTLGELPSRCVILGLGVGSEDADPRPVVTAVLPAVLEELARV